MSKRKLSPIAFYTNYTSYGSSPLQIIEDDVVNILINKSMLIWSKKQFTVLKIFDRKTVYLHDEGQEFKMEVGNHYYYKGRIFKAKYGSDLAWRTTDVSTGKEYILRQCLLDKSKLETDKSKTIIPVFPVGTRKIRLFRRLRLTSRGMRTFTLHELENLKL